MDHSNSSNTLEDNINVIDGVTGEKPKSQTSHNLEGIEDNIGVLGKKPETCTSNNTQCRNIDLR